MKKNIQLMLIICLIICIFLYHDSVTSSITTATTLFHSNIFPSLFPFMIISPFLINYGFLNFSKKIIGPLMKLFNLSQNSAYVFVMSLLSGFPGSAIYAKELYNNKIIAKEEVLQLILFSHFSNPIFILTMISSKPLLVIAVHYSLNIVIGILFKNKNIKPNDSNSVQIEQKSFFKVFSSAIKGSMENSLFILGVIVFFFMITSILDNPITNIFLELSQGLSYINTLLIDEKIKLSLAGALLSFGGFSIHMQTYGILADMNFSYFKYLKTRLIHALLTFIIIYILY